jgi:ABC-type sugar transport system permease subunit
MNFIIPSLAISVIFMIYKIIDMKYISKVDISLKDITKDSLIVFLCSMISMFGLEQLNINEIIGNSKESLSAFTNEPDF